MGSFPPLAVAREAVLALVPCRIRGLTDDSSIHQEVKSGRLLSLLSLISLYVQAYDGASNLAGLLLSLLPLPKRLYHRLIASQSRFEKAKYQRYVSLLGGVWE